MLRSVVHTILWLLSYLMLFLHLPMRFYFQLQRKKLCPPVYDDVLLMTATTLAEEIRQQRISSMKVVTKYINRAKEVDKIVNAIVEERFSSALDEAKHADDFVQSGGLTIDELREKYPLLGVPVTVKECIAVMGMSRGAGSKIHPYRAECDNVSIQTLKSFGAIIIAITNVPELCMNWETMNYVTGRTLNPYDTRRTSGGSSGGEAALIGACGSLIGIGSDMVGSGRGPPSFCGVYGHRTSSGLTSSDNCIPTLDHNVLTLSPITRYAVDLPLVLRCIASPQHQVQQIKLLEEVEPTSIRVYYKYGSGSTFPTSSVHKDIVNAMKRAVRHIDDYGLYVHEAELNLLSDQFDIAFINLLSIEEAYAAMSYTDISVAKELLRSLLCAPRITLTILMYEMLHFFCRLLMSDEVIERNRKLGETLKSEIEEMLGDDGVLLYPTLTHVANIHGNVYGQMLDVCYMAIINALDLPSTVIPIGKDANGLPIGIQVIAKHKNDRLCFAMARFMERTFGGWSPPEYSTHK